MCLLETIETSKSANYILLRCFSHVKTPLLNASQLPWCLWIHLFFFFFLKEVHLHQRGPLLCQVYACSLLTYLNMCRCQPCRLNVSIAYFCKPELFHLFMWYQVNICTVSYILDSDWTYVIWANFIVHCGCDHYNQITNTWLI